ncbi:MAG: AmmeMemoRadiSam system radical SAM enzyme [Planctomycetes bacterium]|nr:AmmeMemoRadiSam system radical SAM enzyme [Planctomycetota bacterium]
MEAAFYEKIGDGRVACKLCPHNCVIAEGRRGICRVRENRGGTLYALTYARVASVAMDPIEKKPLYHFYPGGDILSIGTWGCNFSCRFCQNWTLSMQEVETEEFPPDRLAATAASRGSIGVAYTYNEPTIWWEYLYDSCRAVREAGLKNVLVTNGFVNMEPLEKLLPYVDAMNIDIKAFHEGFYKELCGVKLESVLEVVERASKNCHVEVTTLIVPGHNDAPKELDNLASWVAEHCGRQTPAHLSAYFPRYKLDVEATGESLLLHSREIFRKHLDYVYLGNVSTADGSDTDCVKCGAKVIARSGYRIDTAGMSQDGRCANCGFDNNMVNS